jgi:hypothetical protein
MYILIRSKIMCSHFMLRILFQKTSHNSRKIFSLDEGNFVFFGGEGGIALFLALHKSRKIFSLDDGNSQFFLGGGGIELFPAFRIECGFLYYYFHRSISDSHNLFSKKFNRTVITFL